MEDSISRQAAIDIAKDLRSCMSVEAYWAWIFRLKKLPSVVADVKDTEVIIFKNLRFTPEELGIIKNSSACYIIPDPVQKRGSWLFCKSTEDLMCSNCLHYWIPNGDQYEYHYCPNCGARMEESE